MNISNKEFVKFLYKHKNLLDELAPDFLNIDLQSHSTAIHCNIFLTKEGSKKLKVWYKTNWVNSSYEFNERGKSIGIQPGCFFIQPILDKLYADISEKVSITEQEVEEKTSKEKSIEENEYFDLIQEYSDYISS